MRRFGPGLLCALLGAIPASGQSLGELARKERERRAAVERSERPAAVFSEKELEEARGGSLSIAESSVVRATAPTAEAAASGSWDADGRLSAKEAAALRQEWSRIWEEQTREAEADLERAKEDRYQCRSAERYFFVPIAVDCEGVDLRVANAEARLKKVKRNRYNWELLLPEGRKP
jgi:hypothetical protein